MRSMQLHLLWAGSLANPNVNTHARTHARKYPPPPPMQVQALRSIERYLGLDALYVLGTNCVDNGPRAGLDTFLHAASRDPGSVLHYEFMQVRMLCMLCCGGGRARDNAA